MMLLVNKICIVATILCLGSSPVFSADIFKADHHFTNQQYELARAGYLEATKVGNPYACYQLANMYFKGLGGDKDVLNALVYFSLAAEYNFHDSQALVQRMLHLLPEQERQNVQQILNTFINEHGKNHIRQTYLPLLNQDTLADKIRFAGKDELILEQFDLTFADNELFDSYTTSLGSDGESSNEIDYSLLTSTRQPFLIVDFDLAADGSIRNIAEVQKFGYVTTLIDQFSHFPLDKPTIQQHSAEFVARAYLGAAAYNKFTLVQEDEALYAAIRRKVKSLKNATSLKDRYEYAMALQNFPWLDQKDNEVEQRLKSLAEEGHPGAMYEYGLKLYREQKQIPQAIEWIVSASKYGLARAESRLGRLLLSSPWIVKDEKKAVFWLESAGQKKDVTALFKAAEIRLTAEDKELHDIPLAIDHLAKIAYQQSQNPEYFYLLALTYRFREQRDFPLAIQHLERAITMGQRTNWDVSAWQGLLNQLMTGQVTISHEN
ncbi:sel1 repeat family protein [Paraglaciecola sp.]|uniref:tetratricopeptide repeat protein n=1 Tax=Paraglaciecola sp. TaxID=1920173 RepID=UPI00273F9B2F|nr:sel1 repeat family protein [Paraglaciecola sp.]MDP5030916.1 sel1 repeat family protein [Paraglaciecola sp.]